MPLTPLPEGFALTYLGHSTVLFRTPKGARVLIDAFVSSCPTCPLRNEDIGDIDLFLVTHGHDDHIADALPIAQSGNFPIVLVPEIAAYFGRKGVAPERLLASNKGGTLVFDDLGVSVTLTHADHTSSITDGDQVLYGGEPVGFMITLHGEEPYTFYHAGDTAIFGDMNLLSDLYQPSLALLPIGDRFTMGPIEAAKASELLASVEAVIPIHYGTFPLLTGTPDAYREALNHVEATVQVIEMKPGETREDW
jgi:Predicted Zn-dependent hydrolases of the beta-lactamase fold